MNILLLFLLTLPFAHAEDDFSKEVEKATPLTASLYMIEGAGGNITASIGQDGVLLVDDDFAQMGEKLLSKLKELKGGSPRFIVNTHFHYDHSGGNDFFSTTATIISATEVRNRLMEEQILWHKTHAPVSLKALPTLTFNDSLKLHFNGDTVKIIHLPQGHTDGDSIVIFEKGKVVSLGDLYFSGMFPIFHPEHHGSLAGLVRNLEIILKETPSDAKIIPGHGALSDKTQLEKYYKMIIASISTVKSGIQKGWTLSQIQKKGLDHQWEQFSHGYRSTDQWLEAIYGSIESNIKTKK